MQHHTYPTSRPVSQRFAINRLSHSAPAEFAKLIDSEIAKWALVVKTSGAKIDSAGIQTEDHKPTLPM